MKCVKDYGEWYHFEFNYSDRDMYFVCQKSLLTQGSIEEFEKSKEEGTVKNGDEVFKCNMKITIYHEKEPNVGYSIN